MVKIRLQRHGRKQRAFYYIVAADQRAPRDGRYIERLGSYNPNTNPATIDLDLEASVRWLQNGAIPTDTCRAILSYKGALYKSHLLTGVTKGALSEDDANQKFGQWLETKADQIDAKREKLKQKKDEQVASAHKAEEDKRKAREKAIAAKNNPEMAAETPSEEVAEEVAVEAGTKDTESSSEVSEEAIVETEIAAETPSEEVGEEVVVEAGAKDAESSSEASEEAVAETEIAAETSSEEVVEEVAVDADTNDSESASEATIEEAVQETSELEDTPEVVATADQEISAEETTAEMEKDQEAIAEETTTEAEETEAQEETNSEQSSEEK